MGEVVHKVLTGRYDEAPLRDKRVDNRVVRVLRKMLSKDPERATRRPTKWSRDLETAARRARMADDDESRLEILIRASYPLVCVYSFEEDRVIAAVQAIAGGFRRIAASAAPSMSGAPRRGCATGRRAGRARLH